MDLRKIGTPFHNMGYLVLATDAGTITHYGYSDIGRDIVNN